jgi:hypothetical protein
MDEQDKQTEVVEEAAQKKYLVIDRYGVVELSDTKYFIKD